MGECSMKLFVDSDMNCGGSWLHEVVCRQRHDLWVRDVYMKLCVDRDGTVGES